MRLRILEGAFVLVAIALVQASAFAQATTVFSGIPATKVSEGGVERMAENLNREKAVNFACVISEIGGKYYWASRENRLMVRIEKGAFITYMATDASGYVRIVAPHMKEAVSLMGDTETKFDYVEHLLIGLKSVTYYGTASQ